MGQSLIPLLSKHTKKRKGVLNSLIFQPLIHSLTDAPTYTAFFSQTVFFDAFHLLWIEADGLLDSLLAIRFLWSCHTTTSALFIIMVVGNSSKRFWYYIKIEGKFWCLCRLTRKKDMTSRIKYVICSKSNCKKGLKSVK